MARKHLLAGITSSLASADRENASSEARADYAKRGASRSMMQSLDEMAENSMRVLEGETIVSLDPGILDGSTFSDRISDDDDEFNALVKAIDEAGQSSPILVRPHPEAPGRFMIVYGHRRARAAKQLGIKVRAVIKPLADIAHVIAQGQENAARANLSFIEKALFARKLFASGMEKATVKTALTVDDTLLSRMLSVAEGVPEEILNAVGSARGVGRDRWEEVKKLSLDAVRANRAIEFINSSSFGTLNSDARFNAVLHHLKQSRRAKISKNTTTSKSWTLVNKALDVSTKDAGKQFTLSLKSKDASAFGAFLSKRLEGFYQEFLRTESDETGD